MSKLFSYISTSQARYSRSSRILTYMYVVVREEAVKLHAVYSLRRSFLQNDSAKAILLVDATNALSFNSLNCQVAPSVTSIICPSINGSSISSYPKKVPPKVIL
jgi:hypothetical protein